MLKHSITKNKVLAAYTPPQYVPNKKYSQEEYDKVLEHCGIKEGDWIAATVLRDARDLWQVWYVRRIERDVTKIHSFLHSGVPEGILGFKAWPLPNGVGVCKWERLPPSNRRPLRPDEIEKLIDDQVLNRINEARKEYEQLFPRRSEDSGGSITDPETPFSSPC